MKILRLCGASIIFLVLIISCLTIVSYGTEEKLDRVAAELILADIEKDRDSAIQQRIIALLEKYNALGLSEKFPGQVLSFLAACSAAKMVEIEESMTAEELVEYANDSQRSSDDGNRITDECLEVLQDMVKGKQENQ